MSAHLFVVLVQLTFRDVITGIPHDAGSILVYVILAAFLYGVWRGSTSRRSKTGAPAAGQSEMTRPEVQSKGRT